MWSVFAATSRKPGRGSLTLIKPRLGDGTYECMLDHLDIFGV